MLYELEEDEDAKDNFKSLLKELGLSDDILK